MALDRRAFLKFATGAGVGIMATPVPWKLIDDASIWTQNWPWIPANPRGENTYIPMTSKLCPSACGVKVRMVANQPLRTVSNPEHPLGGGLSALAAAEMQLMYSPARLKEPLKRNSDNSYSRISWDEAELILKAGLQKAGREVACLSGDETGSSVEVLSALLANMGSNDMYLMPSETQASVRALQLMGVQDAQLAYNFEGCDLILAIGANVLESWGSFIATRKEFNKTHPHGEAPQTALIYAGPVQNNTAAVAGSWLPIKPGTEAVLALGLAHLLVISGFADAQAFSLFSDRLSAFTPAKVAGITGVSESSLGVVAQQLRNAKNPVVVVGGEFNQGGGAAPIMAGLALNMLLGSRNVALRRVTPAQLPRGKNRNQVFTGDAVAYLNGKPSAKAMIFYDANPVYALPDPASVKAAIEAVPFKVSFSAFMDETAQLCDLVLPQTLGAERLDDIETPLGAPGVFYGLSLPIVKPSFAARHGMDVLLTMARELGFNMPASYEAVIKSKADAIGAKYADLAKGGVFTSPATIAPGNLNLNADALFKAVEAISAEPGLRLAPCQKVALGTAQSGIPPFNVKTIRQGELVQGRLCAQMNGATASAQGVSHGQSITLTAGGRSIPAVVYVNEGIAPDTVGVYMGFGHSALDDFSKNKGANVAELFTVTAEPSTGLSVWSVNSVSIAKA